MPGEEWTEILVVGSGIAGLTAALGAERRADVMVVTKNALAEGATRYAQGGIAAALDPSDSVADHAADTLEAGAGLCEEHAVRVLCEEGPGAIRRLMGRGVRFDRVDGAKGPFATCLEGAHSRPRILHAGGDATGGAIENALVDAVRRRDIPVRENTALVDLVIEHDRVRGAELLTADGTRRTVRCDAVVLATGGAGQLFSHTTNPPVATGDGVAAAWRAGAVLTDLELYQFHPTALVDAGAFLVSEAVRGEGAVLRDARGRRFLPDVDPRGELAPRDVVARTIAQVMAAQAGAPVLLDASRIGARRLRERFPTIDAVVRAAGHDWGRAPIPVTPAAHYWMGGIRTDIDGRTTVRGLFAAGECARTGVHGANRLASNSLLEGAVFGARTADAAVASIGADDMTSGPSGPSPRMAAQTVAETSTAVLIEGNPPRGTGSPTPRTWARADLQALLWRDVGLLRTGEMLDRAAARLAAWTPPAPTTITALEDRNLLDLARLVTEHALARTASVGAHHRLDSTPEVLAC